MSKCLGREDLNRFHAGEMHDSDRNEVQSHLSNCPSCSSLNESVLEQHHQAIARIRNMGSGPPTEPYDKERHCEGESLSELRIDGTSAWLARWLTRRPSYPLLVR